MGAALDGADEQAAVEMANRMTKANRVADMGLPPIASAVSCRAVTGPAPGIGACRDRGIGFLWIPALVYATCPVVAAARPDERSWAWHRLPELGQKHAVEARSGPVAADDQDPAIREERRCVACSGFRELRSRLESAR